MAEKFEVICDNCGKKFFQSRKNLNRSLKKGTIHRFCSRECQWAYQKNGTIVHCDNCGKEFYLPKTQLEMTEHHFCSRECVHKCISHSHPHSDETKQKISDGVKRHLEEHGFTPTQYTREQKQQIVRKQKETFLKKLLECDWDELSYEAKKKRVAFEQNNKCARCGIDSWQGQKIILEFEHKDGNHSNNSRDNVECLCPNCHSLTSTWRGRNSHRCGKNRDVISDEQIVNAFMEEGNIHRTLIHLGLVPKGANYLRVKEVLAMYNISWKQKNKRV